MQKWSRCFLIKRIVNSSNIKIFFINFWQCYVFLQLRCGVVFRTCIILIWKTIYTFWKLCIETKPFIETIKKFLLVINFLLSQDDVSRTCEPFTSEDVTRKYFSIRVTFNENQYNVLSCRLETWTFGNNASYGNRNTRIMLI